MFKTCLTGRYVIDGEDGHMNSLSGQWELPTRSLQHHTPGARSLQASPPILAQVSARRCDGAEEKDGTAQCGACHNMVCSRLQAWSPREGAVFQLDLESFLSGQAPTSIVPIEKFFLFDKAL